MKSNSKYTLLKVWAILLTIPALLVASFYLIFGQLNYFGLDAWFKTVFATGPIAAYVYLVWFGYVKVYKDLQEREEKSMKREAPKIFGHWKFKSDTVTGNEGRTGKCNITLEQGNLVFSGTFLDEGINTGSWKSIMSTFDDNRCLIFYELDVLNRKVKKSFHFEGISLLYIESDSLNKMQGFWRVIGKDAPMGYIEFTKVDQE